MPKRPQRQGKPCSPLVSTGLFQAPAHLSNKVLHIGLEFGLGKRLAKARLTGITKTGRARVDLIFTKVDGTEVVFKKGALCRVVISFGFPILTSYEMNYQLPKYHPDTLDAAYGSTGFAEHLAVISEWYSRALAVHSLAGYDWARQLARKEWERRFPKEFEGMRFVFPGDGLRVRVVKCLGERVLLLGGDFFERAARFAQFDEDSPTVLVADTFLKHTELCCGGHKIEDFVLRRDYSHEVALAFALKFWTNDVGAFLPKEVAKIIFGYYLETQREIARDYCDSPHNRTPSGRKANLAIALPWQVMDDVDARSSQ